MERREERRKHRVSCVPVRKRQIRGEVTERRGTAGGKKTRRKRQTKGTEEFRYLGEVVDVSFRNEEWKNYRPVLTAHSLLHHLFSHLSTVQAIHLMRLSNCPIDDCLSIKPQQNHHYSACCFVMMCARQSVRERKRGKEG